MGQGVPISGPGSVKEPLILQDGKMCCPRCMGTCNIWRNEVVLRSTQIEVREDGTWDFSGNDEICWDTSDRHEGEPEFFCRACDVYFEAPNTVCPDQQIDAKLTDKGVEATNG